MRQAWAVLAALSAACSARGGVVVFVDDDAPPGGDGSTWEQAYRFLQDGLAAAGGASEVRVGQGLYPPDRDASVPGGSGDRRRSFVVPGGVTIAGGYAGFGADDPGERDIERFPTILTGDLAGNDGPWFAGDGENSYHVLRAEAVGREAGLDGCVVSGGNADGGDGQPLGGGLLNVAGSPTLVRCTFRGNRAAGRGGAIHNLSGRPRITACTLQDNAALAGGGLMNEDGGRAIVNGCTFAANDALSGGGLANFESAADLTDCAFEANTAVVGAAVYNLASGAVLLDCTFSGNAAEALGGAIHNSSGGPTVKRCAFDGNTAGGGGGAMSNAGSATPSVNTCRFSGNATGPGGAGGAIYLEPESVASISGTFFCGNAPDDIAGEFQDQGGNEFADTCGGDCPGDLDGNGEVDFADVLQVFAAWGPCEGCPEDLDGSGEVDFADVLVVLLAWGACPG